MVISRKLPMRLTGLTVLRPADMGGWWVRLEFRGGLGQLYIEHVVDDEYPPIQRMLGREFEVVIRPKEEEA